MHKDLLPTPKSTKQGGCSPAQDWEVEARESREFKVTLNYTSTKARLDGFRDTVSKADRNMR